MSINHLKLKLIELISGLLVRITSKVVAESLIMFYTPYNSHIFCKLLGSFILKFMSPIKTDKHESLVHVSHNSENTSLKSSSATRGGLTIDMILRSDSKPNLYITIWTTSYTKHN